MGDTAAALEYKQQSKAFLEKAQQYFAADDLHQACEKGWGAASHMAKALAEVYDLKYTRHDHFNHVMRRAEQLTGNSMMGYWRAKASELHTGVYERMTLMDRAIIEESLGDMASLLAVMKPLVDAQTRE